MMLLNPKKVKYENLDPESRELMLKTIEFFENKGKAKIKHDDQERVWYQDFLDYQASVNAFARLMTPPAYGADDARMDSYRNCYFNEILGFYGLPYWYTWQVTMLGLGPIFISSNEAVKKKTGELLRQGGIFAFGLSEKQHGADLIASEMTLSSDGKGGYIANGSKYYIGNANKAALVSTFGKVAETGEYVFFVVESDHPNYTCVKNTVNSQNYVAEYKLENYPIKEADILSRGREAWDASLSTIAYCKYNLGWATIGICTHAFHEAINHASNRVLFKHAVTEFPHIKAFFVEAYARLVAMKLFALRASDYMRVASETDKRYLLYNPMVKMKVTMQGEEVINLIWDVIAAKGFEKDMYFEMAARDIRALPKLEGTAQVNMVLIIKFMKKFLMEPKEFAAIGLQDHQKNDDFLFHQGATSKGQNKIEFHDYNIAYKSKDLPNIKVFREQIEVLKKLLGDEAAPDKEQSRDLDFMLIVGELFTLVAYGQLIIENAQLQSIDDDMLNTIFDFMVRDFSRYALQLYSKSSSTAAQQAICMEMIRKPVVDKDQFDRVWQQKVYSLKDTYEMNP
ncbi:MAG: acyl-CoA dehydrogenase [Leptospiraceae bacterium]|nr:acyl-CoA dehydrogenase [Leptospiraceae bacterium]